MKKLLPLCGLLLMLSVLFVSCKKKNDVKTDALTGAWSETPQQSYDRRIIFNTDGKFSLQVLGPDGYPQLTLNGKYIIKGDSLTVTIMENLEKQGAGKVVKTVTNYNIFEKGTFSVKDNVLTLNYLTYPADAPVLTQSKFNQILSID